MNNTKKFDNIDWDSYFMYIALLSSKRSKDPCTKVGACIVDNETNRILSIGYNGMPNNVDDNLICWGKSENPNYENDKRFYVCHAELNAILNSNNLNLIKNSKIYCTLFPCNECMKAIIQSGIKEIIYLEDEDNTKETFKASMKMANLANIKIRKINKLNKLVLE